MKFGPENHDDILELNEFLRLDREIKNLETLFVEKCRLRDETGRKLGYIPKNSVLRLDEVMSVEEYSLLPNNPSPGGYCDCDGCVDGTGCRVEQGG